MAATVTIEDRAIAFHNQLQSFSIVNHGYVNLKDFFAAALDSFIVRMTAIIEDE